MSPVPAAALLAALAAVALITDRGWVVAAIAIGLLLLCLRAPRGRRRMYLVGTLGSALSVFLLSPLVSQVGTHVIWDGPKIPVVGYLDVTSEEIAAAGIQALRLAAVGLAFAAYQRGPRGPIQPDSVYDGVVRLARRFGYGPRPTQTVYEYTGALGDELPAARPSLELVARAKVEVAYGRRELG